MSAQTQLIVDDAGRNENEQLGLVIGPLIAAEQIAKHRYVTQERDFNRIV